MKVKEKPGAVEAAPEAGRYQYKVIRCAPEVAQEILNVNAESGWQLRSSHGDRIELVLVLERSV